MVTQEPSRSDTGPNRQERRPPQETLVCSTCGRRPEPGEEAAARLTWSRELTGSRDHGSTDELSDAAVTWTCERCSRAHLRSIESKLDPEWW
jgi:hypothetical protein